MRTHHTRRHLALFTATACLLAVTACSTGPDPEHGDQHQGTGHGNGGHHESTSTGLAATERGYTLDQPRLNGAGGLTLRILGPSGRPQTKFQVVQTKRLHLYLVRQDLADFHHLHPELAADGSWHTSVRLETGGPYRVFTEFTAVDLGGEGTHLVLSRPLSAPGRYQPRPLPAATSSVPVPGGYTVTWSGAARAGQHSALSARITRAGRPVTDLQPYLDSYAHLTAFRAGDLAVSHLHPQHTGRGPELRFAATFPGAGDYLMFLQFRAGDQLRLAPMRLRVS